MYLFQMYTTATVEEETTLRLLLKERPTARERSRLVETDKEVHLRDT